MKNKLHLILISFFSLTIISCSDTNSDGVASVVDTVLEPVTDVVEDAGDVIVDSVEATSDIVVGDSSCSSIITTPSLSTNASAGQVALDWNAVDCAISYTVFWDNSTGISSSSNSITGISDNNYTHINLDNGSTYYYKVAAIDAANTSSDLSSEVSDATPLPTPDNLSISGTSGSNILTWNSVSGATSYTLYWDNVSGIDSSDTAITSITNENYTHSSLGNGTYYYKLAAVNSSGTGTLSSVGRSILASDIEGSETNDGHTYALTSSKMNWASAASAAAIAGGYLTTLNTKEENTWLYNKFGKYGGKNRDLWIGAKDDVTEGSWIWDNGTTSTDGGVTDNTSTGAQWPDGTNKWAPNEPNNWGGSEDCLSMRGSINTQRWNDYPCTNSYYGIIEID